MADYDRAIAVTPSDQGRWTVDLDGSWSIGGSMNGGYLLAAMVGAATTATQRPDPLAVTATFLSPRRAGPAEITVAVVKRGRRSTVTEIVLGQDGRDHVRATAVLGDLDSWRDRPSTPSDHRCPASSSASRSPTGRAREASDLRRSSSISTSAWLRVSDG